MRKGFNIFVITALLAFCFSLNSAEKVRITACGIEGRYLSNTSILHQLDENYVHTGPRIHAKPVARRIKALKEKCFGVANSCNLQTKFISFPSTQYFSQYRAVANSVRIVSIAERAPPFFI